MNIEAMLALKEGTKVRMLTPINATTKAGEPIVIPAGTVGTLGRHRYLVGKGRTVDVTFEPDATGIIHQPLPVYPFEVAQ